jgi:hypothetical protein
MRKAKGTEEKTNRFRQFSPKRHSNERSNTEMLKENLELHRPEKK